MVHYGTLRFSAPSRTYTRSARDLLARTRRWYGAGRLRSWHTRV